MSDPRVSGAQRYSQDVELPGAWEAAFVRSPHAHARVRRIDASALPAGALALLPEDVEGLGRYGCQLKDQTVLASTARFAGDIVAAVAAPTRAEARAAAQVLEVDYEELPAVLDPLSAVAEGAPLLHPDAGSSARDAVSIGVRPLPGTNVCHRFRLVQGEVEEGFARAGAVVEETFRVAGAQHAPMEPHASAALWTDNGQLELHTGTQTPFNLRADLAGLFGIDEERIRVVGAPDGRLVRGQDLHPARGARRLPGAQGGAPGEGRARPLGGVAHAQPAPRGRAGTAGSSSGRHARGQASSTAGWTPAPTPTAGPVWPPKLGYAGIGPYRIPHVRVDSLAVYTNLPPNGAFRGYGATQSVWASERAMDLLAQRLGLSPLELRRRNLLRDGDRFATGELMHDVHFEECLQAAADAVEYERDPRGKGLCVLLKGMQTPSRAAIAVERTPVGYVIRSASCEMGQGIRQSLRLHRRRVCSAVSPVRSRCPTRTPTAPPTTRAPPPAARRT